MANITFDLNEPKDSSKNDKAAQNGRTPKSLTLEIHHGGCFTQIPSRSYVGGQVSSVNDIDEFCLHDLKDMVVKLVYGLADLMYCHFLIPRLGLDYGLYPLNVDVDVLEMAKYVTDYKIILVYVEHGSSIFVTPKKNLTKEWEQVSSKSLSIGEVMKILSKKHPSSYVEAPIVAECVDDPFKDLDEILGDYANTKKQITGNEIIEKQMGRGWPVEKFKEVNVNADNESEEESHTKEDYTSVEDVRVSMKNFCFTTDPNHDLSIGAVEVHEDDLDVSDYDSFVQDQMQKQFDVGVSKMKASRAKRIATDKMTRIYREQYSLLIEYAQELINQNLGTTVRIDVQQEPNPEFMTRTFRMMYVCLGDLKPGFRACGREILGLDGCFMSGP
nr:transposase, mutator type [Tanacetum cinerariifolium]